MSVQNILVPNNNDIYCKNLSVAGDFDVTSISADTISADTISASEGIFGSVSTEEILADPGAFITLSNNMAPISDEAVSLGTGGRGFNNLFCKNLCGLGGPVNVVTSINGPIISNAITNLAITDPVGIVGAGNSGTDPVRLNNGLIFGNTGSTTSTALSTYYTIAATPSTQGSVSGPFAAISIVDWVATRIGNTVSLRFRFNRTNCSNVLATIFITLGVGFNSIFYPSTGVGFSVPVSLGDGAATAALGYIDSSGNITITSLTNGNMTFANAQAVGLAVPNGTYYQINYNI